MDLFGVLEADRQDQGAYMCHVDFENSPVIPIGPLLYHKLSLSLSLSARACVTFFVRMSPCIFIAAASPIHVDGGQNSEKKLHIIIIDVLRSSRQHGKSSHP